MAIQVSCFSCGQVLSFSESVGRRDECSKCGADVHSCKNCIFFDLNSYNECREPTADAVREKERANFCEFFQARSGSTAVVDQQAAMHAAAEALFKKKP